MGSKSRSRKTFVDEEKASRQSQARWFTGSEPYQTGSVPSSSPKSRNERIKRRRAARERVVRQEEIREKRKK